MLTKALLRVTRRGASYRPQFVGTDGHTLAAAVIDTYRDLVGDERADLEDELSELERDADDFKLVRGLAKLVDDTAVFEVESPLPPRRARRAAFEAAEAVGVCSEVDRLTALQCAGDELGASADEVETALHADRHERERLVSVSKEWSPPDLVAAYNRSLAQTSLFDATELRVRSSDPRGLVTTTKALGLLYQLERPETDESGPLDVWQVEQSVVVVTGPDALFRSTRRYGTRFARLLTAISRSSSWSLEATIDDRGTERTMRLDDDDPITPPETSGAPPDEYDSDVEADFASRFDSLDLDWDLVREPDVLAAGSRVTIPDFAFDYRYADARIFFEIMGFWTPEYVTRKLETFGSLEDVELVVAYDESLDAGTSGDQDGSAGREAADVGTAIEAADHRAIPYRDRVRIKDVRDVLRRYERELESAHATELPDEVVPDDDVVSFATLAERRGVSEGVVETGSFPEHDRIGRTLVRPTVLEQLADEIEPGMSLAAVESVLDDVGLDDTSALLSRLDYRVAWEGLGGGTVEERE